MLLQTARHILTAAVLLWAPGALAQADVPRSLTPVTDDVWRFDNNRHVGMVVDTGEGIVVADPINASAAAWLESKIDQQFGRPVTHLIFSHHHGDHASGGEVFNDTALVIAHETFMAEAAKRSVDVPQPDLTFRKSMTFRIGMKTFEFVHVGAGGHSDDLIVTVVRPDNVAFAVDFVSVKRLPYRTIPGGSVEALIDQIEVLEALDFEILLPGHGKTGVKEDATLSRIYLQDLRAVVKKGMAAGKSRDAIVADARSALAPAYGTWALWEQWLPDNVDGVIRRLKE
ncbi:MAG: MBL fold metallo-hydrolase [Alphaproteobacteria bacterium]